MHLYLIRDMADYIDLVNRSSDTKIVVVNLKNYGCLLFY